MTGWFSSQWPIVLRYGPVTLRPLALRDEPAWNRLRERNRLWTGPWDSTRPIESVEPPITYAGMVRDFNRRARRGGMLPWAIAYHETPEARGELAGQLTISGIAHGSASWAQVGYWVDEKWAGRGIVPLALALGGDYCFHTLRLHRLEVAVRPENLKSLRVVEKLGFRYEGRRPSYMHVDGDWRDHEMFALHREEVPEGLLARLRL
ncbi:MAG: GNAT family protein [Micropruina sp.]